MSCDLALPLEVSTAPPPESLKRRRMSERIKSEWDSLLWVFAAFAVFYFTNFGSTLIFNEAVNRLGPHGLA